MKTTERLAFDRASVRTFDGNGRLQVKVSNISKANVCPYFGREIPGADKLGLDPEKIYYLWRHPDELKKAVATFNNIPLLSIHTPDFPGDPPREYRVGVTHSNADFDGTYLTNGLSVWDNSAIAGIETEEQEELSSSYQYVADMTPGTTPNGEVYDGIMREIIGNHVALVETGRAGSDVLVADSLPPELKHMSKRKAAAIRATLKPLLAADADLEAEVRKALLALDEADKEDKKDKPAEDEETEEEKEEREAKEKAAQDEETEEEKKEREAKEKAANDEDDDKKDDKVSKTAMDSAIRLAADSATKKAAQNFREIREAELAVRPLIGDVVAMDSAADVYRTALEQSGVDIKGVHPSAFPSLVKMAISQKESSRPAALAQDSASISEFESAFPTAGKLKRGF
ncbi:DUF2213 domain-containing protein [Citrobacter sp. MGH106]|uniref:DUF2213 domain-containing protein n=1 Tax=Citrobacter sp. MGH106 TaxID=1686381 RepID=UPI000650C262|nr:DUF2213 domain-containing protein [Citrobacter sp. MGH106]KLV66307.1 hypothetical protein SK36_01017 [Citrobacter sp. MGH106]